MNREQRRSKVKSLQKEGFSKEAALGIVRIQDYMAKNPKTAELSEGQAVKLNTEKLLDGDHDAMNQRYLEFLLSASERVFHVHIEDKLGTAIVSLQEEPTWLFWSGDLIPFTE